MEQAAPSPTDILFLRETSDHAISAPAAGHGENDLLHELRDTLQELKQALHTALLGSRSGSKEARQWLLNSIAALDLQDTSTKRRRFAQFLPRGAACHGAEHAPLCRAMLQLLFEAAPTEVGALLAQDASLVRRFFESDPKRVHLWFGHFSMEGMRRFKHGAAALAQYSLGHRAEMWDLLAWQGRHPQAPVAVAQRSHYFCELDLPRTLRHLIRDCPGFWSSPEMRASVEEGAAQLLALDPPFWSKELLRWLQDRRASRGDTLHALLCRCLELGPWGHHCQRLLHLLPHRDLLPFAEDLLGGSGVPARSSEATGKASAPAAAAPAAAGRQPAASPAQPGAWLAFRGVRWPDLDALLLASALGCSLPLLLRLLRDDELADERQRALQAVQRLLCLRHAPERQAAARVAHWRLRAQLLRQQSEAAQVQLHELLLLHLFAAAFTTQQLAGGGSADLQQLQGLLSASGFACELAAAGSERQQRRSSRGRKKRGRKEERRSSGSKKQGHRKEEKKRKKKRRRRRSRGASSSSSSGGDSDSDGGGSVSGKLEGSPELGAAGGGQEEEQQQQQQHLRRLGGAAASSLELVDAVATAAAAAHAAWLFG